MLVTDAMPPVGGTRSGFTLYGEEISFATGAACAATGRSPARPSTWRARYATPSASSAPRCRTRCAWRAPPRAAAIGLGGRLGRLAPGFRADLVALEPASVAVLRTWVAGEASPPA